MNLEDTLTQIEQRRCAQLSSPWNCRDCGQEQPSPEDDDRCAACQAKLVTWQTELALKGLKYRLTTEAHIPPRYLADSMTLPTFDLSPYCEGRGLMLRGPAGTGKTTALCLIAREDCVRTIRATGALGTMPWRFVSFPAFVMELQDAWRREDAERTAFGLLKAAANVSRLIIDDLGAEKLTEYIRQATYYLLNEREQWQRPTYITTNFSLEQLDQQFDSRISSRIAGMCDVKVMSGKDRRLVRS